MITMKQQTVDTDKDVLVIGAGVSGLSSAILLGQAGYKVTIWAKELTMETTSSKAAAFWYPYLCDPPDRAIVWSKATYDYLVGHVMHDSGAGVRYMNFTEYLRKPSPDPWWRAAVEVFERPALKELPDGYVDAYKIKAILMDTSLYLPWLLKQAELLDLGIQRRNLQNIDEALAEFDVVINCSGLGARELCEDQSMFPVRGQVLRVKANGFGEQVVADESYDNLSFIIPRCNDVILGGTHQSGDWNLEPNDKDTEDILRKVKQIAPHLSNIKIIEEKVGLRPTRPAVRLEKEERGDKVIIHNYGHGGAGFTLSWGCAQEVVGLLKALPKDDR